MNKKIILSLIVLSFCSFVNAQVINFPDANFKAKLIMLGFDTDTDGEISQAEAAQVTSLPLSYANISNLTGIEYFINVIYLQCNGNNLTSINISNLTHLDIFYAEGMDFLTSLSVTGCPGLGSINAANNTQLSTFNVSGCPNLYTIRLANCNLTSLDFSACPGLQSIVLEINHLTSLNLSGCSILNSLYADNNQLTSLNVSGYSNLNYIYVNNNQLTSLNVSGCSNLIHINANNNHLATLDLSDCRNLDSAALINNSLATLFAKNGSTETFSIQDNPNLSYICADESQLVDIQTNVNAQGYSNCSVNSYCSFVPGGTSYAIQGNAKFDENNNGCDASDINFPNLKYAITNGAVTGSLISSPSGNYLIPVQAGTHTITPVLENSNYFTVSPTNITVTFPTQTSPFTQNFCLVANGVHSDLEVSVLLMTPARPGFDAVYKVVYKNKGNTTQSGTVNLSFNDAILDFVSANPAAISTLNSLSWNFTNLAPFETREITFTLNVNSPSETPAVNGGDILNYTATISSAAVDEIPNDNTLVLNQTVVNSFDPNDKTCLEGTTITPDKVGEYVHYMIRFENNGTFPVQNIVVKDMIDTAKFDVTSLVPMKGSHNFTTRIDGSKVEFIFENINLPFDDANNDGYVAFKIKTKPTLVNGNTFSNSASIYFDYNKPIVTNTATTTIQALSVQDFTFSSYFNLYPNPVHDVLNIGTKDTIEISSINIYNTLGQLVLVIPNAKNTKTVDVSSLTSDNYFIKINSDKGTSNTKFIKN